MPEPVAFFHPDDISRVAREMAAEFGVERTPAEWERFCWDLIGSYRKAARDAGAHDIAALPDADIWDRIRAVVARMETELKGPDPDRFDPCESARPCEHEGCTRDGLPCHEPGGHADDDDGPTTWYCTEHAAEHGFCWCCGEFWGGVESFDFGSGLCEHCRDEVGDDEEDEDWDDDEGY